MKAGSTIGLARRVLHTGNASNALEAAITGSPGEKLDLAGNVRAQSFLDRDNPAYFVNPADITTAATFSGKVGIGTADPSYKLHTEGIGYFADGIATSDGTAGVGNRFRSRMLNASQTICTIRQVRLAETQGSYCHYGGHRNEGPGGVFLSGYVAPNTTANT